MKNRVLRHLRQRVNQLQQTVDETVGSEEAEVLYNQVRLLEDLIGEISQLPV